MPHYRLSTHDLVSARSFSPAAKKKFSSTSRTGTGLHVHFFPQHLCTVPSRETTGSRFAADTKVRRSKGAVLYMIHGVCGALARMTLTAFRHRPRQDAAKVWRDMFDGMRYVLTTPLNEGLGDEIPLDFQPIDILKLPLTALPLLFIAHEKSTCLSEEKQVLLFCCGERIPITCGSCRNGS